MSFNQVEARILARERNTVSTAAQTSVGAVAGQILAANATRRGLMIQNTGATVLYLVLGSGTPTTTVYHVALKACASGDDGSGGIFLDDSWTGAVQAIGSAGGGTCVITEIT
jgi:hypothetical protein